MRVAHGRICLCLPVALVALAALTAFASFAAEGRQPSHATSEAARAHSAQTPSPPSRSAQTNSSPSHSTQAPSTLAQYRARVRESVAPLEDLAAFCELLSRSEKPEVWSRKDFDPDVALQFPKREKDALERVRA